MIITFLFAILIGIFLAHVFADTLKAAAIVVFVLIAVYVCRGVSFQALVDEGARALYDHPAESCGAPYHHSGRGI